MLETDFAAYLYYYFILFIFENRDTLPYKGLGSCVSLKN